ncbi:MAG: hypothetical protein V3T33_00965 [Myxococcota bacterium]
MWLRSAFGVAIALVILLHFFSIARYSLDVPVEDDYALLAYLSELDRTPRVSEQLALLFAQHNEHRMVVQKALSLAMWKTASALDFEALITLGNLSLLGLLFLFSSWIPPGRRKILILPALSLALFQFQAWENSLWAAAALSYAPMLFFAGMAFHFMTPTRTDGRLERTDLALSIGFASLAFFTTGGGIFVFLTGLLYLLVVRRFKAALVWLAATALNLGAYFFDYAWRATTLHSPTHLLDMTRYFFTFLGSAASLDDHYFAALAPIFGILAVSHFLYLSVKKYYLESPRIYLLMFFILLAVAAVTWTRTALGLPSAFESRYRIFSLVYAILAYLSLRDRSSGRDEIFETALSCYAIVFALSFYLLSYSQSGPRMRFHRQFYLTNMLEWGLGRTSLAGYPEFEPILITALDNGLYRFPCEALPPKSMGEVRWCHGPASLEGGEPAAPEPRPRRNPQP